MSDYITTKIIYNDDNKCSIVYAAIAAYISDDFMLLTDLEYLLEDLKITDEYIVYDYMFNFTSIIGVDSLIDYKVRYDIANNCNYTNAANSVLMHADKFTDILSKLDYRKLIYNIDSINKFMLMLNDNSEYNTACRNYIEYIIDSSIKLDQNPVLAIVELIRRYIDHGVIFNGSVLEVSDIINYYKLKQ